jgi:hypothetical protein
MFKQYYIFFFKQWYRYSILSEEKEYFLNKVLRLQNGGSVVCMSKFKNGPGCGFLNQIIYLFNSIPKKSRCRDDAAYIN